MGGLQIGRRRLASGVGRRLVLAGVALLVALGQPWPPPDAQAANFTVNSTSDFHDADPGDGICRSAPGNACTLRAAIEEANATAASDTVSVPAGTYTLPLGTLAVSGGTLTIAGAGMDSTIIQASADPATVSHRVFEIAAGTITIRRLTVRHGHPVGAVPEIPGGGLAVHGGNVRLDQLRLLNNRIDYVVGGQVFTGRGGGLHVDGTNTGQASVAITNSIIEGNQAPFGAGIFCTGRDGPVTLQIVNSTIQENTSPFRGGRRDDRRL